MNIGLGNICCGRQSKHILPMRIKAKKLSIVEQLDMQENITGYRVILEEGQIMYDGKGKYININSTR